MPGGKVEFPLLVEAVVLYLLPAQLRAEQGMDNKSSLGIQALKGQKKS